MGIIIFIIVVAVIWIFFTVLQNNTDKIVEFDMKRQQKREHELHQQTNEEPNKAKEEQDQLIEEYKIENKKFNEYIKQNKFNENGGIKKNFNILGTDFQIYSDLKTYHEMQLYFQIQCDILNRLVDNYNKQIETVEQALAIIQYYDIALNEKYNLIAQELVNVVIEYDIFNIDVNTVISNIKATKDVENVLRNGTDKQSKNKDVVNAQVQEIKNAVQQVLNTPNEPLPFGIITDSPLAMLTYGLAEANNMNKKFTKEEADFFQEMANKANEIVGTANSYAMTTDLEIATELKNINVKVFNEMFDYLIDLLVTNNKMNKNVIENIDIQKAEVIRNNISNITDNEKKKSPLIDVLKLNPFLKEAHIELKKYEELDINQYKAFVEFIGYNEN